MITFGPLLNAVQFPGWSSADVLDAMLSYAAALPEQPAEGAATHSAQEARTVAHLAQLFDRQLVGTPAQCIARIREIVEQTTIRHFILLLSLIHI